MKLGLLVRTLSRQGGTERFVHGLARHLLAQGHELHCWCAGVDSPIEGLHLHQLSMPARGRLGKMLALDRSARAIDAGGLDLLLGFVRGGCPQLYRAGGGSHRAWVARLGRPALDLPGRAVDELEARIEDRVLAQARRVVANSELARADLLRFSGLAPHKVEVVRNGVDLERFQPATREPGPPRLLFLGHGWRRKGLETALEALALLPAEVRLEVGGAERHPDRWRRLARRLGVEARVTWRGAVSRPELLLPQADALVLPTRYDPSANVCMEALACGVAVVTSATNGACEVLPEPWMTVTDPQDAPAFARALERVLQTPGLGPRCRAVALDWPDHGAFHRIALLAAALVDDPAAAGDP